MTSTARLNQPVGACGSSLIANHDTETEFGVKQFEIYPGAESTGYWQIMDGPLAGAVIHESLLNFDI